MPDAPARPVALITGASSGIGAAFARALARRGYDLILVARRREKLDELAKELAGDITVDILTADLTFEGELQRVEERIARTPVDLLVNNAGFGSLGRFWKNDLMTLDKMHRLHVLATMRLTYAALRGMTARERGSIVNVASVAGLIQTGNTSYSGTKFWINAFTESLRLELRMAGSPVRVQALCPGFTITEFHDKLPGGRQGLPKFLWMRADDVVEASLRGLIKDKLFVVPGWIYKLLVLIVPRLPRSVRNAGIVRLSRRREDN